MSSPGISTEVMGAPLSRPNTVFPFVDIRTGCLTEHGRQMLGQVYDFIVGMNRLTPCIATGTNVIALTPLAVSPRLQKYVDYEVFTFVAANSSTGAVTMTVIPKTGTLATLKAYKSSGASQAGSGDVVAGSVYLAIYVDSLNSGVGGFVIK